MMASKKKPDEVGEGSEVAAPAVTFESIAVDTLNGLVDNQGSEAHKLDIVARALARVVALAVTAEA